MAYRYLFLDLDQVTRLERLYRRVHQPQRHPENPILQGEHPWETVASLYGTVLYDPKERQFKMWYLTGPYADGMVQIRGRETLGNVTMLGYATSADGVHWEKPNLGQIDYEGSRANNLVDLGRSNCEGMAVLYDEQDQDPGRRYKGFYWEHGGLNTYVTHKSGRTIWGKGEGDGMWMSFSPDGIHWTNCEQNPVIPLDSDTTQSLIRDPQTGKYVIFGRFGAGGRKIARAESDDCVHFTEPKLVLACDDPDEEGTQIYGMPITIYEGIYLGMIWIYREGVDGTIDTALATSRDGIHWQRTLDRQTFLSLGEPGGWEDGMTRITQNVLTVGDRIYLYYGGVNGPHGGRKFKQITRTTPSMVGLATLRRDGFVSLDAGEEEGVMLTKPLRIDGDRLFLNADAGHLIISVTDDQGVPLSGYTSPRITGDDVAHGVSFERPLSALKGRDVRLCFHLQRTSLYSFWFAE